MTLDNLLGRSLESVTPEAATINRLLEASERSLTDAKLAGISPEGRFDMAYKAIMQLSNLALQANGFRTLTSKPDHHQTMIQTLPMTINLDPESVIVLDSLRKQRNVIDYSGDVVSASMASAAVEQAESLHAFVVKWLSHTRAELLS